MQSGHGTLNELFNAGVDRYRESEFLRFKRDGEWRSLSFGEVARRVRELALGLHSLGLQSGDRVAIWSENRPEWNLSDLATLAIGAVDVPVYSTQARGQVEYILADAGVKTIFVSSSFLTDAIAIKDSIPSLERVICFDNLPDDISDESVIQIESIVKEGRAVFGEKPDLYETLWRAAKPDDLATLIYTSGTTGNPKGVMLTHRNLTANVMNSYRCLKLDRVRDLALTYLPFSHIFERAVWYLYIQCGAVVAYAESIDKVADNLKEIRPTAMTSVPRMFEKIYTKILERGIASGFPKKQLFLWSLEVGRKWAEKKDRGESIGFFLAIKHRIADKLVFKKLREAVGGRVRVFISGGAALAPDIDYFFAGAGLRILQGYGLTETSPVISCNTEEHNRVGTVGKVVEGVTVKIDEDGEILVKGDTVMQGYYNRPEDTEKCFTSDGWFRTGDIGHLDKDGFLVITDRKKELIKTSGGKYIAPQQIESLIKSSRFVSQVVVIGNDRKFASALVVPNMEMIRNYAGMKGIKAESEEKLLSDARIVDLIQRQIDKYTSGLSKYEKIKKVALLAEEMTIEGGELTPTLKPRRKVIDQKYAQIIERLYEESGQLAAV